MFVQTYICSLSIIYGARRTVVSPKRCLILNRTVILILFIILFECIYIDIWYDMELVLRIPR